MNRTGFARAVKNAQKRGAQMNRVSARACAAAIVALATGEISTSLVPVPNGLGPNSLTYDLTVHVSGGDNWTSSSLKGDPIGAEFYQDWVGGNTTPNPSLFPLSPTLEWDTFVTQPGAWPNTPTQGAAVGGTINMSKTFIDATWFDTPPNGGDGDWVVARISLVNLQPDWSLSVQGAHSTIKGGAQLFPYSFVVPEPGTGALLILCVLLARRAGRILRGQARFFRSRRPAPQAAKGEGG